MVLAFKNVCIAFFCLQIWGHISGGAASGFNAAATDHPGCRSTAGAIAQHHWGTLSRITCTDYLSVLVSYACNKALHFWSQGKYSRQTLKDVQTFLRYMETPNNVKVCLRKPQISNVGISGCNRQSESPFHISTGVVQ